jgi:hypothetical protein
MVRLHGCRSSRQQWWRRRPDSPIGRTSLARHGATWGDLPAAFRCDNSNRNRLTNKGAIGTGGDRDEGRAMQDPAIVLFKTPRATERMIW